MKKDITAPTEIRFDKTQCGVAFFLNTGMGTEHAPHYTSEQEYITDYFEFLFAEESGGKVWIEQESIEIKANSILFLSPYQRHKWQLTGDTDRFHYLIFQEDFLHHFLADKYFTYRLLYCYPNGTPPILGVEQEEMQKYILLLNEIKQELRRTISDSEQILRSQFFYLLLQINRSYAAAYHLPFKKAQNNYAFQFRQLMEQHIREKHRVNDYCDLMGITRVTLNKAVKIQFGVTATEVLKKRLLIEIKQQLLNANKTVSEVAYKLHFPEPNHLTRFFKQQAGQTISEFLMETHRLFNNIAVKTK